MDKKYKFNEYDEDYCSFLRIIMCLINVISSYVTSNLSRNTAKPATIGMLKVETIVYAYDCIFGAFFFLHKYFVEWEKIIQVKNVLFFFRVQRIVRKNWLKMIFVKKKWFAISWRANSIQSANRSVVSITPNCVWWVITISALFEITTRTKWKKKKAQNNRMNAVLCTIIGIVFAHKHIKYLSNAREEKKKNYARYNNHDA